MCARGFFKPLLATAPLLLLFGAPRGLQAATNLVANPGFEDTPGTFNNSSWTLTGDPNYTFINTVAESGPADPPHTGFCQVNFGQAGAEGVISQNIPTIVGGLYHVDFWLWSDGAFDATSLQINEFTASFGGVPGFELLDVPQTTSADPADNNYVEMSFDLPATSTSTALEFGGRSDEGYLQLDDVSVALVPEPASAGLLGALAGIALLRRRR